jgi:acyl-CoA thioester hydrolase
VESWECDYNSHWNTRFYGRSFQLAAEAIASRFGGSNPGASIPHIRHIRYHRELFGSATVEVRSAVLRCRGGLNGAIVHILADEDGVSATALDLPGTEYQLPQVSTEEVSLALPRGVKPDTMGDWPEGEANGMDFELGPIRPGEVDHTGSLLFEELIRYGSIASNLQMNKLGLTPEFSERTRVGRMAVELRVTRHFSPAVGETLCGQSRISTVKRKSIRADHRIMTAWGETVATLEFCVVTVDLDTRRAVEVPRQLIDAGRN